MKIILTLIIAIYSIHLHAEHSKDDISKVMHSYLSSIKNKDESSIKDVVTKKYFKIMSKDGQLKELFSLQKSDKNKIEFDLSFKPYGKEKNKYLVNIKDKSQKEYGHYWYVLLLEDNRLKIDHEEFLE